MAYTSVSNTFVNGSVADAGAVNTNFADIINGLSDGTKDISIAALTAAGATLLNGAVTLGNATGDDITVTGYLASALIPKTDATYALGGASNAFSSLYIEGLSNLDGNVVINESSADVDFRVETNGLTHTLFVDGGADKVGFGCAGPTAQITMAQAAATEPPGLGSAGGRLAIINGGTTDGLGYGLFAGISNSGWAWLQSQSNSSATAYALNLQPSGGYVGIGITAPSQLLHVENKSGGGTWIGIGDSVNYAAPALIGCDGTGAAAIYTQSTNAIRLYTNGSERVNISSTGVVVISNLSGSGSRTVTADASGTLAAASDISLKVIVHEHIPGLSEVMKLKPKAYKWKSDIAKRGDEASVEIGFIANEVAEIIPSAAPKCSDGMYGFYDRSVIATLVKAIQEQQSNIESLKSRLDILGSR